MSGGPVPPGKVPPPSKVPPQSKVPPAPKPGQPVGSEVPKTPRAATPPTGAPPGPSAPPNGGKTVGELFIEVSEQVTVLVREEIELAKTELTEKAGRLLRGSVVGLVAGIFLLLALLLIMHGIAIVLGDNVFGHRAWLGYLVEAAAFVLFAAGAGLYAYRALKKGSPPVPEMAIEQAKEIRATLDSSKGSK
ncbi:MAG: phage holin family protein [Solirubrobacterales bacterium]